jgi:ribonuclease P/MRP protein subunit RPP40
MRVNGKLSKWQNIGNGIPQGSILGPTLFVIFTNDMIENCTNGSEIFYMLMIKVTTYVRNGEDSKKRIIGQIWSNAWMLKLDTNKCKAASYGKHINHDYGYYIKENETCNTLQKVNAINDLGITLICT